MNSVKYIGSGHLVQQNGRDRGSRRNHDRRYDLSRILVPQSDFNFETSNAKCNKKDLAKKVKITPNYDLKDENCVDGIEFGPEEEDDDGLMPLAKTYNMAKSFFDNISCEIKERLERQGPSGRELSMAEQKQKQPEEKHLNLEAFEQFSIDSERYYSDYRNCCKSRCKYCGGCEIREGYSNRYIGE
ncbi:8935_t:CDS:2 [Racocetra fulgida]|uniref:8935_t:CDS:1 n=1 Tax=Racocetra fulgida TaxID=60492 RepID=A0A9N8ZWJ5_9GLOM|nr:8935_t:CDS:2 [Racocetra fulgida]